jgi:hypothetical protein
MHNKNNKNTVKKALLKKIVKAKTKKGASPIKMDGGLGKNALSGSTVSSGGGSNLGSNGIF